MSLSAHLAFWAKTPQIDSNASTTYHPIAYHLLDVAASCKALLDTDPSLGRDVARVCSVHQDDACGLLVTLAAMHDIGKFSEGFQAKVPALRPIELGPMPKVPPGGVYGNHQAVGHWLFSDELLDERASVLGDMGDDFDSWASAVFHHHGRPQKVHSLDSRQVGQAGIDAARSCIDEILDTLGVTPFGGTCDERALKNLSWRVAGIMTLADWLGSDQARFPCAAPTLTVREYWDQAQPNAREAVHAAGFRRAAPAVRGGYAALTGRTEPPSPMQAWAERLPSDKLRNSLIIVEDMTGSGKTEAALVLAHAAMRGGHADGTYVGLPTMATANGLYGRLGRTYRKLFADDVEPSLMLSHGGRAMNRAFMDSVATVPSSVSDDVGPSCSAWLASDSRRALFAQVGVGTVDQALLAALPSKFAPLRQHALARRVLVLDEVHAYDAYMGEEVAGLVEFQAALGGTTVILSATLPERTRRALMVAHAVGQGRRLDPVTPAPAYPCVTWVGAGDDATCESIAPRPDLPRTVPVRRIPTVAQGISVLVDAARRGACAAYIRNSVAEAIEAYQAILAQGVEATLFHARFTAEDRAEIEADVVRRFGAEGDAEDRRGRVVVATQVIEQSLDIDFDVLVSDLAPIDLLIQRMGRLWRHGRGERPVACEFLVVSPEPADEVATDWCTSMFPTGAHVYPDHSLLWLSAKCLFDAGHVSSPGEPGDSGAVRALVDAVYGEGRCRTPESLDSRHDRSFARDVSHRMVARNNMLRASTGYGGDLAGWDVEERIPTRLGRPQVRICLAKVLGGKISPWSGGGDGFRAWARSELTVARQIVRRAPLDGSPEGMARRADVEVAEVVKERLLVPLAQDAVSGDWSGKVVDVDGAYRIVTYDSRLGYRLSKAEPSRDAG